MINFWKKVNCHIDFKINKITLLPILVALSVLPCVKYLPQHFGYENGLLENIQMFFLFLSCFIAFKVKGNKKFFIFVALVLIILILREVNCGRTLFFPIPGTENAFYSWKEIKYGWLAHPLYGIYIACVCLYFLWNKLYITLWHMIKNIKLPFWNISLMLTGLTMGLYAEKVLDNMVFEECSELLFYVALFSIIYLYGYKNSNPDKL